jgi:hypothetical protein
MDVEQHLPPNPDRDEPPEDSPPRSRGHAVVNECKGATPTPSPPEARSGLEALGDLADNALLTERDLAEMFSKHPVSIKRAVDRGELPPATRIMGKPSWFVGTIRHHIQERLRREQEAYDRLHVEKKQLGARPPQGD